MGCHFPAAEELEVYDSFSADDFKSTEADKRNQRRNELCCQGRFSKKALFDTTIWKDQDSLRQFVMAEPHATAIKKFTEWAGRALHLWNGPAQAVQLIGQKF
jgi:hypothetical protein